MRGTTQTFLLAPSPTGAILRSDLSIGLNARDVPLCLPLVWPWMIRF
jgi:hypothetical protein